jgi:hypothetical protein
MSLVKSAMTPLGRRVASVRTLSNRDANTDHQRRRKSDSPMVSPPEQCASPLK